MFMKMPHAILVRAGEPLEGVEEMLKRTGKEKLDNSLTRGPGNFSKALGIYTIHSGMSLLGNKMFIADDGFRYKKKEIAASPRIGVDYAGERCIVGLSVLRKRESFCERQSPDR